MYFTQIQEVFAEVATVESDCPEDPEEMAISFKNKPKFDDTAVLQTLEDLSKDPLVSPLWEHIDKCRGKVPELHRKLLFMDSCLPEMSRSGPSTKEQGWSKFYHSLTQNLSDITTVTENTQLSSLLCLRLFKQLMDSQSTPHSSPVSVQKHSQQELDTISYIGGNVVSMVKEAAKHLFGEDNLQCNEVLSLLVVTQSEDIENPTMTDHKYQGGLIKIKPQITHMFVTMENVYKSMFSAKTKQTVTQFVQKCADQPDIFYGFYETVYESEVVDALKEKVLVQILKLYFKIRVHDKCCSFMDKVGKKAHLSKKEKTSC